MALLGAPFPDAAAITRATELLPPVPMPWSTQVIARALDLELRELDFYCFVDEEVFTAANALRIAESPKAARRARAELAAALSAVNSSARLRRVVQGGL